MSDSLGIMVEAKKEYLGQLCLIMCPPMIEVFQDMYDEASKMSNGRKVLIMYQKLLKEVPNWSNAMSKNHSDNITNRCAWFSDLLAAVFVACTKILSAVRLKADNKKISLKLPTEEVFIQTCYNNVAKDLYRDPYVFHEDQNEYARDEKLISRFTLCIETTVKELIPVQQILQTYMSQESRDISLDGEIHDSMDPDVVDEYPMESDHEPEEPEEPREPEEPEEPAPAPAPAPMVEPAPAPTPMAEPRLVNEFETELKTVPGVPANPAPVAHQPVNTDDDDVLFGDAPEQRTKKVGYY